MTENRTYPAVVSVACSADYTLVVTFDNGEQGLLDMEPYLDFGVFRKLQDPGVFRTVHISFDTIAWDSGADLDPEFVYKKCRITERRSKETS